MAFRSRSRAPRRGARKKAVWVNIPFGAVAFTESVGSQLLLTPEDWEAQFGGNDNETAVLRAIVGTLTIQQTVIGTIGTTGFWMLYINDKDATVVPNFTVADLGDIDILRTGAFGTSGALVGATEGQPSNSIPITVKAKRRLKSRDAVRLALQYGADAAAPAGVAGGLLRFLVARD